MQPGDASAGDSRPVEQVKDQAQGRGRPCRPAQPQATGRQGREIEPACSGRGKHQTVAAATQAQLEAEVGVDSEDGVAEIRCQGQRAEPAVFAGQTGGEGAGQGQRRVAGGGQSATAAKGGTRGQMEKPRAGGRSHMVAEQQRARLDRGAATVAAGGIQPHAAGAVEAEAVDARDRDLQVQQGTGRGFETIVGSQSQGQASVGTAENDLGRGVHEGQAGVQGQGARKNAATAVGIHMKNLRQPVERPVKGDAPGRPIAAQAHLAEQGGAAVATGEVQFGTRRLGRQCIALPVGSTVPRGTQSAGAAIPDTGGSRAGGQATEPQARTEAAGADADRRAEGKAGRLHEAPRIPQRLTGIYLK